jgi:hypothetical protein
VVYSTQFFQGVFPTTYGTVILTVPAGEVWVLREIDYSGSVPDHLWIDFSTAGSPDFTLGETIPASYTNYAQWTGRLVCPPGSTLILYSDLATVNGILSGYRLTTP